MPDEQVTQSNEHEMPEWLRSLVKWFLAVQGRDVATMLPEYEAAYRDQPPRHNKQELRAIRVGELHALMSLNARERLCKTDPKRRVGEHVVADEELLDANQSLTEDVTAWREWAQSRCQSDSLTDQEMRAAMDARRVEGLREKLALADIARHGLRCDTNPTIGGKIKVHGDNEETRVRSVITGFYDYIQKAEAELKQRAKDALGVKVDRPDGRDERLEGQLLDAMIETLAKGDTPVYRVTTVETDKRGHMKDVKVGVLSDRDLAGLWDEQKALDQINAMKHNCATSKGRLRTTATIEDADISDESLPELTEEESEQVKAMGSNIVLALQDREWYKVVKRRPVKGMGDKLGDVLDATQNVIRNYFKDRGRAKMTERIEREVRNLLLAADWPRPDRSRVDTEAADEGDMLTFRVEWNGIGSGLVQINLLKLDYILRDRYRQYAGSRFGVHPMDLSSEQVTAARVQAHVETYGSGVKSLNEQLKPTDEQARKMMADFEKAYPGALEKAKRETPEKLAAMSDEDYAAFRADMGELMSADFLKTVDEMRTREQEAIAEYEAALADGLSDAEARDRAWPSTERAGELKVVKVKRYVRPQIGPPEFKHKQASGADIVRERTEAKIKHYTGRKPAPTSPLSDILDQREREQTRHEQELSPNYAELEQVVLKHDTTEYGRAMQKSNDPVHQHDGEWWFWDESWSDRHGPFDSRPEAQEELDYYCITQLGQFGDAQTRVNPKPEDGTVSPATGSRIVHLTRLFSTGTRPWTKARIEALVQQRDGKLVEFSPLPTGTRLMVDFGDAVLRMEVPTA